MQVYNILYTYRRSPPPSRVWRSLQIANCIIAHAAAAAATAVEVTYVILLCTLERLYRLIYNYTVCAQDVVVLYVRAQVVERIMNVSRVGSIDTRAAPGAIGEISQSIFYFPREFFFVTILFERE